MLFSCRDSRRFSECFRLLTGCIISCHQSLPSSQALLISHLHPTMLTSSPAFSSYSNHSPSVKSIASNFVPVGPPSLSSLAEVKPSASQSPSALNFTNSKPRQSKLMIFAVLGGEEWFKGMGASRMLAVCSLLQFLHLHTKLASPLDPDCSFFSKRLMETQFGWISRQEVHWTLKV